MRTMNRVCCGIVSIVVLWSGLAWAQTVTSTGGMRVLDVDGTCIGQATPFRPNDDDFSKLAVTLKRGNQYFVLNLDDLGFRPPTTQVFFETPDLSGQPYLSAVFTSLLAPVAMIPPGNVLYIPVAGAVPQTIQVRSILDPNFDEQGLDPFPHQVVAAESIDLDTLFTPPFQLDTSATEGDCPSLAAPVAAVTRALPPTRKAAHKSRKKGR